VPAAEAVLALPLARTLKAGSVYDALKRDIVLGRLAQGKPLAELSLAERFGCSQSSVREALFRLQEDGLVWREGYRGTSVSATTIEEARELLALRLRLEPKGLRRGFARVDAGLIEKLAGSIQEMEEQARADDLFGLTEQDREFHLTIFRIAGLRAFEPILARCFLLLHRFTLANPARQRTALEAASRHWDIIEALGSREVERAELALSMHIATVVEGMPELKEVEGQ
jgi:GntR family transcriptional regulator, rspAB operon transcriptional repressor